MPRIVDHAVFRADLLQRSFQLFADKGYAAVTMRGLAQALGVSTGTLYHYFSGKPAIFEQMLQHRAAQDLAAAEADIAPDLPTADRLAAMLRFLEARAEGLQGVLLVSLDAWRRADDEARAALIRTARTYRDGLAARLGLSDDATARLLFSFVLGLLVHRTLDPESEDLAAHVALLVGLTPP